MLKLTVEVTPDCESLISNMPSGYGYELDSEEYSSDGSGTITVLIHSHLTDVTRGMAQALDTHPGVVGWDVEYIED